MILAEELLLRNGISFKNLNEKYGHDIMDMNPNEHYKAIYVQSPSDIVYALDKDIKEPISFIVTNVRKPLITPKYEAQTIISKFDFGLKTTAVQEPIEYNIDIAVEEEDILNDNLTGVQ